VQVEWGIGGLKKKWKHFMKMFDSTKPKYSHLFQAATLLINFLHRKHMDFTYEIIGDHDTNLITHGWARDF
jgi:hypothetical protein